MAIYCEIPEDLQQSLSPQGKERPWWIFKIHTIVGPNHSTEIDALKSQRMLRGEKNVIHKEWKGCHSKIRPLFPPSVCHTVSFSLSLSFMMRQRSEILKNTWNMITSVESFFFLTILVLLANITSGKCRRTKGAINFGELWHDYTSLSLSKWSAPIRIYHISLFNSGSDMCHDRKQRL